MDISNLNDLVKGPRSLTTETPEEVLSYLLKASGRSLSDVIFALGRIAHNRRSITDEEWCIISKRFENAYFNHLKRRNVGLEDTIEKELKCLTTISRAASKSRIKTGLTEKQQELYDLMSAISEEHWWAEWANGLEFDLWKRIKSEDPSPYGIGQIDPELLKKLRELSEDNGGWIYTDESFNAHFIPMAEWEDMIEKELKSLQER